jgi:hypothetical protein
MILAYVVLFFQWPTWATIAAILAGAGVIWKFGESLLSMVKKWHEAVESRRRLKETTRKIGEEQRERAIRTMVANIEMEEFKEQQKLGQSNYRVSHVVVSRGEDREIVEEAWRRFKAKRDEQDKKDWRKG